LKEIAIARGCHYRLRSPCEFLKDKENRFQFSMVIDLFRLKPHAFWNCVFETYRWRGCLFLVSVYCHVKVSSSGRSLVQRSPTECDLYECDREASIMRSPWPTRGLSHLGGKQMTYSDTGVLIFHESHKYMYLKQILSFLFKTNVVYLPSARAEKVTLLVAGRSGLETSYIK
jgi:hypothetical protein